jgi:nitrogen fixation protein NifB
MDLTKHPCFNESARKTSVRVHLPVAPRCNIQCNYCKRDHDCVNESRPGVTSKVITPAQAMRYLEEMTSRDHRITVVGIAGPGDPFANPEATMETLRLVRARFPEMLLCVATNGLNVGPYVEQLAGLAVSHVTLTVNAVDARIGEKIYAWVREEPRVYRGQAAAELLIGRQLAAVVALKAKGITVKINTIIIPGVNDEHIPEVARRMAELGADIINCVPLYPVDDTPFAIIPDPTPDQIASLREEVSRFLPIMSHCARCRADAAGLIGEQNSTEIATILSRCATSPLDAQDNRPYVAVATQEGVLVNQHLGEALDLSIFQQIDNRFERVETRSTPPSGGGRERWLALAETLKDCRALLVASAGPAPTAVLTYKGIRVVMMEGLIEEGLYAVYQNQELRAPLRARHSCGSGCVGNGTGCL